MTTRDIGVFEISRSNAIPRPSLKRTRFSKQIRLGLLLAPGLLWLVAFMIAPIVLMTVMSFWKSDIFGTVPAFQLGNYRALFESPLYFEQLAKTLRVAMMATVLSLIVSYPIAYFISRRTGRWKGLWALCLFLPFWTSYVVRTFVWVPILGRTGLINQTLLAAGIINEPLDWLLYNEVAVLIGLVYVYTLYMTLPIFFSIEKIDPKLIEAASDLGAKPIEIFYCVILPLTKPGVAAGCIMVFLLTTSAYVTPQLLGGTSGSLFSNVIASQFMANNNWAFGATLSVVLIMVVLIVMGLAGKWIGIRRIFIGAGH
jgi:spermidine/putrescine transport system permease protein